MWKIYFQLPVIITFLFSGVAFGQGKDFVINGKIPEMEEGQMIVVTQLVGRTDTLGTGVIHNGSFRVEGKIDEPCVALIHVAGYSGGFIFILDTDAPYEMELYQSAKSTIKGGYLQSELIAYEAIVAEENQKIGALKKEVAKAAAEKRFRSENELKEQLKQQTEAARVRLDEMIERNKENVFAAYVQTAGTDRMELPGLKACYAGLSEQAKETGPGRLLAARIHSLEGVNVNAVAPDFTLPASDNKEVSLYDVKGKVKIIDFWASWCGPCRLENPKLVALHRDYKDKGLAVISVSLDEDRDKWLGAIEKDGLDWLHLSDLKGWKGEVVKLYNIDGVPTIFVLDEHNKIIAKNLRGEQLRSFIADRLD